MPETPGATLQIPPLPGEGDQCANETTLLLAARCVNGSWVIQGLEAEELGPPPGLQSKPAENKGGCCD